MQGIYAITDPVLTPGEKVIDAAEQVLSAGVKYLQYRDKHSPPETKLSLAKQLVELCNKHNAKLIVNDDLELAKISNAHGVHLGQSDGSIKKARVRLGSEAIIGSTCHQSLELAKAAELDGASYCAFGAFFKSKTKPNTQLAPLALLSDAQQIINIPIVAIGGINLNNMPDLINRGANAIALCNSIFAAENIFQTALEYTHSFKINNEFN